jgi:hypothetical protein
LPPFLLTCSAPYDATIFGADAFDMEPQILFTTSIHSMSRWDL